MNFNYKTILFFAILFTVSSCGDDPLLSERIIGTWNFESVQLTDCDDPTDNSELIEPDDNECFVFAGGQVCNVILNFSNDGNATESYTEGNDSDQDEFTYLVDDENEMISLCESSNDCTAITVNGDVLTRFVEEGGCYITIKYRKS